jgi:elongation factor G
MWNTTMPDDIAHLSLIEVAIEPKSKADQEKLGVALAKLAAEDPSFHVSTDRESGQTILKGTSEEHLDAKIGFLKRDGIDANIGAPQVAFLECITRRVEHSFTHKKQAGSASQFASVTLAIEPNERGKGHAFVSGITSAAVPEEYIPGIKKGLESVFSSGVVAGFPVVDIKVELIDGKYHDIDSSNVAFEIATRACFREALQKAGPVLLEPIMRTEVITPKGCVAAVLRDLKLRRSEIIGLDERSDAVVITAMVPLMNLFGFASPLRQKSNGRGTFTMRFDHYAPAPLAPKDDPPFRPAIGMRA